MPFKIKPPLYSLWQSMRNRCRNPRFKQWKDYGGRGITICPAWNSYQRFVIDMGPRPEGTQLERINNDRGYSPENCKWATRKEQQRNQTVTRRVTVGGIEYVAADLADKAGLKTDTIMTRAALGLTLNEILSPKRRPDGNWKKAVIAAREAQMTKSHCKNGHEFTNKNTYFTKEGWRNCRRCHTIRQTIRRQRAKI